MITIDGPRFVDEHGRTLLLRGVNLAGSSKIPAGPGGPTGVSRSFFDHRNVSFVGRPFPLAEANEHFARLRSWGFTFLRFLVTWEAVEHAGPGIYDTAYLDYLEAVVSKAQEYGISLFIDPHQDVWSRFTGGDGAPGWTLEAVGMDLAKIHETGAAVLHQMLGDPVPRMIWPTNGAKLAAASMFTLFFAGNDYAPRTQIAGESAQDYLQRHYCAALAEVAARLCHHPNVIGYDTMNEPLHGFIGHQDLSRSDALLKLGAAPSPYQSMLLAAGIPQEVPIYTLRLSGSRQIGHRLLNPAGERLWREETCDPWRQHGVWDLDADGRPRLAQPAYFATVHGRPVDFSNHYYRPFANRYAETIRARHPSAIICVQTEVGSAPPRWSESDAARIVYVPHWYDVMTLLFKRYSRFIAYDAARKRLVAGRRAIRRSFAAQLRAFRSESRASLGDAPVLLGEIGVPFDLQNGRAYRTGNYALQVAAVGRSMTALEDALLSCTWWNYSPDNDNAHGDQWNGEDLSIYSRSQQSDPANPDSGGRALSAVVRPYARAVAGEPLVMRFDRLRGIFTLVFRHDRQISEPTEIFIPAYHYPHGVSVAVSDGDYQFDAEARVLRYQPGSDTTEHTVQVRRADAT